MQTGQSFFKFLVEQIFHIFVLLDDFSILTFLGHTHYFCQSWEKYDYKQLTTHLQKAIQ